MRDCDSPKPFFGGTCVGYGEESELGCKLENEDFENDKKKIQNIQIDFNIIYLSKKYLHDRNFINTYFKKPTEIFKIECQNDITKSLTEYFKKNLSIKWIFRGDYLKHKK